MNSNGSWSDFSKNFQPNKNCLALSVLQTIAKVSFSMSELLALAKVDFLD